MRGSMSRPTLTFFPIPAPQFGFWIHSHRIILGLSLPRAAALADIHFSDWAAMEQGWIPDADTDVWRSLAATLQVKFDDLELIVTPTAAHFETA